jgi:phospholipase/carboxylesterase
LLHINSGSASNKTLIWLHGLGADSNDFAPFFSNPLFKEYEIILPNAPYRKITLNQNFEMRAWFNMKSLNLDDLNEEDFIESSKALDLIIEDKLKTNPSSKIYIGGFSQGAALSIFYGLKMTHKIHGVVSFSGFVPKFNYQNTMITKPILRIHGIHDDIINFQTSENTFDLLNFSNLVSKSYNMGHEVIEDQVVDLLSFLKET